MDATVSHTALVTGASRGLGFWLAWELARRGWSVALMARGRAALEAAAADIQKAAAAGAEVIYEPGDVADEASRLRLVKRVDERWGRLQLLVNNASQLGPTPLPPLAEFPVEALEPLFRTNVAAPLRFVQLCLPLLQAAGQALVVNVSSDAAAGGYPGWGGYGASKAALDLMSLTLAHELAGTGVQVLAVDPGDMDTDLHRLAVPDADPADLASPRDMAVRLADLVQRRLAPAGTPDERWRICLAAENGGESRA